MKRNCFIVAVTAFIMSCMPLFAQERAADYYDVYSTEYANRVVDFLADSKLKGREAGTKEGEKAMKFIAKEFKKAGYNPILQPFSREELVSVIGEPRKGKKPYPLQECNVVARLEGKVPGKYIIVGAHYDHLGYIEGVGVHPGADDNASGIVALLSLAKMFKAANTVPEYTILFCAWDGEEKGLLGSKYFVKSWPSDLIVPECDASLKESVVHYMNFDMVGRGADDNPWNLSYLYSANNPVFGEWLQDDTENYNLRLITCYKASKNLIGSSDTSPFARKGIPIVWYHTEGHPDYHLPSDTADKIDYEKGTINIDGKEYELLDKHFPTIDPADPYKLTDEEEEIMDRLEKAFLGCEKLQEHARFLLSKGSLYKVYNGNLLYHGCVPLNEDGTFKEDEENGSNGCAWLYRNWEKLKFKRNESNVRNERINLIEAYSKNVIFLKRWIVIPAFYRDVNFQNADAGKLSHNELTDMYCKLLRFANMVAATSEFDFMVNSNKAKVQECLVEIYDYFKHKLEKKNGLIRKSLLGKTIDYGVRAVIAAPEFRNNRYDDNIVDFTHCAIPISMICTLFYPFMIHELRNFFNEQYEMLNYKIEDLSQYNKKLTGSADLLEFDFYYNDGRVY